MGEVMALPMTQDGNIQWGEGKEVGPRYGHATRDKN